MKTNLFFALAALTSLLTARLPAQVPQLINYQGRIAVGGTNFDGTGQFKFALVNSNASVTFWSNDGASSGGGPPAAAVSVPVSKGLYSVQLGDVALPNMIALPSAVFTSSDVRLRVWFNDGVNGFQLLTPDQRIGSVGYALMAENVPDGAVTTAKLADGAVTSAKLASGAVTATHIAGGAVGASQLAVGAAVANLQASGQAGVASSGMILSEQANAPELISAGYVRSGTLRLAERWEAGSVVNAPGPRRLHSAVWTGRELIVWGGWDGNQGLNTGGLYDPIANTWTALPTNGAPSPRAYPSAVWTGTEMIVWGGGTNTGGIYDPVLNTWRPMATNASPIGRIIPNLVV